MFLNNLKVGTYRTENTRNNYWNLGFSKKGDKLVLFELTIMFKKSYESGEEADKFSGKLHGTRSTN